MALIRALSGSSGGGSGSSCYEEELNNLTTTEYTITCEGLNEISLCSIYIDGSASGNTYFCQLLYNPSLITQFSQIQNKCVVQVAGARDSVITQQIQVLGVASASWQGSITSVSGNVVKFKMPTNFTGMNAKAHIVAVG